MQWHTTTSQAISQISRNNYGNQEGLAESRQEITQIAKRTEAFGAVDVVEQFDLKTCVTMCDHV